MCSEQTEPRQRIWFPQFVRLLPYSNSLLLLSRWRLSPSKPNFLPINLQVHESKVKNDFKAAAGAEKPRQLFWEKRLNGGKFLSSPQVFTAPHIHFQVWELKVWQLTSLPWSCLEASRDCKQSLGKRYEIVCS